MPTRCPRSRSRPVVLRLQPVQADRGHPSLLRHAPRLQVVASVQPATRGWQRIHLRFANYKPLLAALFGDGSEARRKTQAAPEDHRISSAERETEARSSWHRRHGPLRNQGRLAPALALRFQIVATRIVHWRGRQHSVVKPKLFDGTDHGGVILKVKRLLEEQTSVRLIGAPDIRGMSGTLLKTDY